MKKTIVLKVDSEKPELDAIRIAADVIRKGGLVAFPTETVYGLGADALNPRAVEDIYRAKKRPLDNPIIVHIADVPDVYKVSKEVPEAAEKLIDIFWPGPLTLILKASEIVPRITTGGLTTVAIRMPDSKIALALIRESRVPIAAPSANLAGRPSPTLAEHVLKDLDGRIDLVLDGGPTRVGVESTVLDLISDPPQILRPGGVPYEEIKRVIENVRLHPAALAKENVPVDVARSPGMKHRHYAPNAKLIVVEGDLNASLRKVQELVNHYKSLGLKVGVLCTEERTQCLTADTVKSFGRREDLAEIARNLFRVLREFDKDGVDVIIAEGVSEEGLGLAVMNRLRKASGFNIVRAE
ncbi:MAG: L-threonylcarbamoyladenylate synthase [Nitrososphaerota archaeon]|nr:L-threonylcarbamoyladenylate synthase [Candidatus Bathyarchaeota archaeon]MDW8048086.1 L-threonylcarbamoyladenylate synthase [Nitrososphaerota archaeon]